jgi:D-serine deaminase-like pyridoxal phosphate-dependent protein
MSFNESMIGANKQELDTPVLLLDLDIVDSNITKMAQYFRNVKADLRPHTKTHKTPMLAHKQIKAGAIGVTCAKLGEAEVMINSGISDVLIANEIVPPQKINKLAGLARHADVMVAVDDPNNVDNLSLAMQKTNVNLRVLVEVDIGMGRCGVSPGEPALRLAQKVLKSKNLTFAGIMGYEGHTVTIPDFEQRKLKTEQCLVLLAETKDLLEENGIQVSIVSGGGTGTYNITGQFPCMTEIQAGSYIVMDAFYRNVTSDFNCALTVLATVISKPNEDIVIIDAGAKTLTSEFGMPLVKGIDGAKVLSLSEEHGKIDLSECDAVLKPGDKIELIPTHCCTTINLHDSFFGMRSDKLEVIWNIAARGKVW